MGQVLHGSAKTAYAIRRAKQVQLRSNRPLSGTEHALCRRHFVAIASSTVRRSRTLMLLARTTIMSSNLKCWPIIGVCHGFARVSHGLECQTLSQVELLLGRQLVVFGNIVLADHLLRPLRRIIRAVDIIRGCKAASGHDAGVPTTSVLPFSFARTGGDLVKPPAVPNPTACPHKPAGVCHEVCRERTGRQGPAKCLIYKDGA